MRSSGSANNYNIWVASGITYRCLERRPTCTDLRRSSAARLRAVVWGPRRYLETLASFLIGGS